MKKLTKRVQAGGLWFDVPADTATVMVNAFGQVLAISIGVVLSKGEHNWVIEYGIDDFVCPVGSVDLEGADWRECCWYVGDQVDGEVAERREWMARGAETVVSRLENGFVGVDKYEGVCASIKIGRVTIKEIRSGEVDL